MIRKKLLGPTLLLLAYMPGSAATNEPVTDYVLSVSHQGNLVSLHAEQVPLDIVIQALDDQTPVAIEGKAGAMEHVTVDIEAAPLEALIPQLTDRYVLIRDQGTLVSVVLFEEGGEEALQASFKESADLRWRAGKSWREGDLDAAAMFYRLAIDVDPADAQAHQEYGRMLVMSMRYSNALPHLETASQLKPQEPQIWLDLLSYYERTLQVEKAIKARAKAAELAGREAIEQDRSGLWRTRTGSIHPIL